jgi:uncharacterized LabA/DUF88 family protein
MNQLEASRDGQASLAVLIDADNARPDVIKNLLDEVTKYGTASVKRIYGDWTTPQLGSWKKELLELSIQPVQQFSYTTGKNATDSAMIIDAMDLLYTGRFGGFCLVSSDSDFTRLAARLREAGKLVIGFGERKTPKALVSACDKFIYTDLLRMESTATGPRKEQKSPAKDQKLLELLREAIDAASDDSGWAYLGGVGSNVQKRAPDFDSRDYGHKRLSDLMASLDALEFDKTKNRVRVKERSSKG